MANANIQQMVEEYLREWGFDGLWNDGAECACVVGGLMPCDDANVTRCLAGYRVPCDCEEGHRFHVQAERVSTICRRTGRQDCHRCEDMTCGDNLRKGGV